MRRRGRRRAFVDLRPAELEPPAAAPGTFLGRFDRDALGRDLAEAGVFSALVARGFPDLSLDTTRGQGGHGLQVRSGDECLIDLRLAEVKRVSDDPLMRRFGLGILSFLSIEWVEMRDPRRLFTPERPRLPGQRHPGLGVGRALYRRLMAWATAWGKDGLLNVPEYLHNAVFYSESFRFVSPARQGRFEALWRDLCGLGVATASTVLAEGRVVEAPGWAAAVWHTGEMAAPTGPGLAAYFASQEYARASAASRDQVQFSLLSPAG